MTLAPLWQKFEQGSIRCINLQDRHDRKHAVSKVFQQLQMPVQFFETTRDLKGGERGCFESHRAVMRECLSNPNCQYALILEDDVDVLQMPTEETVLEVIRFLETEKDWALLFLGALLNNRHSKLPHYKHILKAHCLETHAYIASRSFMQEFVNVSYETFYAPIDTLFRDHNKAYTVYPTWFYQTNSPSDIVPLSMYKRLPFVNKKIAHLRNVCAHKIHIPFAKESSYYFNIPLMLLLLTCLVIVISLLIVCFIQWCKSKCHRHRSK